MENRSCLYRKRYKEMIYLFDDLKYSSDIVPITSLAYFVEKEFDIKLTGIPKNHISL